jgi:hypothetical protein
MLIAKHLPTFGGDLAQRLAIRVAGMRRREALRCGAKDFFELAAEMGFAGEFKFRDDGFIGVALGDELLGQTALQVTQPPARCAMEMLAEKPL